LDHAELDQLFAAYADMVYRIAFLIVRNAADAEDVVQDTFLRLWRYEKPFASAEHRKAWLIRTARNRAKDRLRAAALRLSAPLQEDAAVTPPETEAAELRDAVLRLPGPYKLPVYLFYYEGYGTAEIAKILHRKESTVRSQLKRAREQLRLDLKDGKDESYGSE